MTIQEFVNKWSGKYLSILSPGRQCFDLVAEFALNNGVPKFPGRPSPFPYLYAYQIYTDFGSHQAKYFDRIANGPLNTPQAGDIMVWKPGYNGGPGHTAVVVDAGVWSFRAFSQNDPVGSRCAIKTYSYGYLSNRGVYGWLRLKKKELTIEEREKLIKEKVNSSLGDTEFRQFVRKLYGV